MVGRAGFENINEDGESNFSKCQEYAKDIISALPHVWRDGIGKNQLGNIKKIACATTRNIKTSKR
jgi:hypothetical protein